MIGCFWYLLGLFSGMFLAIMSCYQIRINPATRCGKDCSFYLMVLLFFSSHLFNMWAYVSGRHVPKRLIGRHAKLVIHLTNLFAAIFLRLYIEYSRMYLHLLMSVYFQVLAAWKLLWGVTDINFCDVLTGALMQIAVYETFSVPHAFIEVLVVSAAVIFCRYWFYSTPVTCLDFREELERPQGSV